MPGPFILPSMIFDDCGLYYLDAPARDFAAGALVDA
jgi:hypothetical protein